MLEKFSNKKNVSKKAPVRKRAKRSATFATLDENEQQSLTILQDGIINRERVDDFEENCPELLDTNILSKRRSSKVSQKRKKSRQIVEQQEFDQENMVPSDDNWSISGLDDFQPDSDDVEFLEDSYLSDFENKGSCINANFLFKYTSLVATVSTVNIFHYVTLIKLSGIKNGMVFPVIKGNSWERASFTGLYQCVSEDPIVLSLISFGNGELLNYKQITIGFPLVEIFGLNQHGLSRITNKSLAPDIETLEFIPASNKFNVSTFSRLGLPEEFVERLSATSNGSSHQKDAMVVFEKLFNNNRNLLEKTLPGYNNVEGVTFKLTVVKKIPRFLLNDNLPGLVAENLRVLVCFVCGLKAPSKFVNSEHFHLSSLLKASGVKEFNSFKCKKTVYTTFEMYIDLLGSFYDNTTLFENIFRNVTSVFKNSTRNIFNAPVQSLVDLLSLQLTNFSLILRRPDLEKCTTEELINVCQRELIINEQVFLLEALTERGSYFQKNNEFKFESKKSSSSANPVSIVKSVSTTNQVGKNKTKGTCFRQLACDLKISTAQCTFKNKCRFEHVSIPNPADNVWKKKIKDQLMSATNLTDPQKYADAIDGL